MQMLVWNKTHQMPKEHQKKFRELGGWDDDMDWVCFVPQGMVEPTFCDHSNVNKFASDDFPGFYYAYYHA